MLKTVAFFIGMALVVILGFVYLNTRSVELPSSLSDATKEERCAKFRTTDNEEGVSVLGYSGRIKQLLNGCF